MGTPYFVRMGESILLEGVGEVYTNPVAIAMDNSTVPMDFGTDVPDDEGHMCDCE